MSLTFQGISFTDISSGVIDTIKMRQQGSGSFIDIGAFSDAHCEIVALSDKGDPANNDVVYAIQTKVNWIGKQTKTAAEISSMAGTAGTGLYDTDVEIEITYRSGRKVTLGAVTGYPLRIVASYDSGGDEEAQQIRYSGENIEPYSGVVAKFT